MGNRNGIQFKTLKKNDKIYYALFSYINIYIYIQYFIISENSMIDRKIKMS